MADLVNVHHAYKRFKGLDFSSSWQPNRATATLTSPYSFSLLLFECQKSYFPHVWWDN